MATIATVTTPAGNWAQNVYYNDYDTAGNWANYHMITTRDNTLIFLDEAGQLNFSTPSRSSIYRQAVSGLTGMSSRGWYGLVEDCQDNIVVAWTNTSGTFYLTKYNRPSDGWKAWVANASRPALTMAYNQAQPSNFSSESTSSPANYANAMGLHVAKVANISSGVLIVTWGCSNRGDSTYPYYVGYTFNLNTSAVISRGEEVSAGSGRFRPMVSVPTATGPYGYGNPTHGAWMGYMSQQPTPFSSMVWIGSRYNLGNYGTYFNISDEHSRAAGSYGHIWARVVVDANGNMDGSDYYNTNSGQQGSKRTYDTSSGAQYGGMSFKTSYAPTNLPTNFTAGTAILISSIFNNKPLLWEVSGTNKWTYSTLPTGFVFDTQVACPIHFIPDTNVVRMFGSNGTALTYIDITWNGTTFTFPASATVVESTGVNRNFRINPLPVYTMQDAFYSTSLSTAISTGSSTSYTYGGTTGSFTEPYVSTLKANNGMKFIFNSTEVTSSYQSSYYPGVGNYLPLKGTDTFQFRRVSSGGTEYYNYTTGAFTSSVVNNASALFPTGGGFIPLSAGTYTLDTSGSWVDNTGYTYSLLFTDENGVTVASNTSATISTPAVSAAPASPTPRRLFVFPLQAKTSSHILSIENRVLINKIHIVNTSASSATMSLNLGGYNILSTQTVAANQTLQINTAITAAVAERLLATCSANSAITLWLMGTEGV